jgi:thiol-disulfide isomerase/thioredoxin
LLATLCLVAAALPFAVDARREVTHALLINGGKQAKFNYQSHLHHLQDMVALLEQRGLPRRRIHIFSADGADNAPDLAVRDAVPPGFWLLAGTRVGRRLRPRTALTDTRWEGMKLRPAKKAALRKWFEAAGRALVAGDRMLIFVTNHGTVNRDELDNGAISLWKEELSVEDLKELLTLLRPGVQTVMVMSQCYSGTFASLIHESATEPSGDVCGFFSTKRDLRAYGCYPEGRDRDRIGHAFNFIDALNRHETTTGAHLEVLFTDDTPDVPLRTSDLYLERLVAAEAKARGIKVDTLVDSLLAEVWQNRAAWEEEIRLLDRIGDAFGTFSPRSLAEIEAYERELPALIDRMKTFAERWKTTLIAVKQENLKRFVGQWPAWQKRLQQASLKKLDDAERKALLAELLPQFESHARAQTELWDRVQTLRDRSRRASEARWRLETRKAALRRMRTILVRIAGLVLLAQEREEDAAKRQVEQQDAYEQLVSCEAFELGELPATHLAAKEPVVEAFPPLADELRLIQEILPSWLGVRFRQVPKTLRSDRRLPAGATWLEAVFPDSPAMAAGLEAGDIILGPPARPFTDYGQLREWTMTSPRDTPLLLKVIRPASRAEEDLEFEATLLLRPLPVVWPELPGPPQVGKMAPALPSGLKFVGSGKLPGLVGRTHLLFFWATWCQPCKQAVPEVMAFAAAKGIPVLAISDEAAGTVSGYLETRQEAFFEWVASDPLRRSFIDYGVSGTPTIVLVDDKGIVRHRQVGYKSKSGLTVEGWHWSRSTASP